MNQKILMIAMWLSEMSLIERIRRARTGRYEYEEDCRNGSPFYLFSIGMRNCT